MVKSPGMSPDMKRAKLEVFPDDKRKGREPINQEDVDRYIDALTSFHVPDEEDMVDVVGDRFKHHPNEDIERYFISSAQWGKPAIPWEIVKPVFLWKLDYVIQTFKKTGRQFPEEAAAPRPPAPPATATSLIVIVPLVFNLEESIDFIMEKAKSFEGFPFTWQRLCELLSTPMKHYNYVEKYVRALDRVINVVTTITVWGAPTEGNDWDMHIDNEVPHLENVFFGTVDEVDAMDQARRLPIQAAFPEVEKKEHDAKDDETKELDPKRRKIEVEEEMDVETEEKKVEEEEKEIKVADEEKKEEDQMEVSVEKKKEEEEEVPAEASETPAVEEEKEKAAEV